MWTFDRSQLVIEIRQRFAARRCVRNRNDSRDGVPRLFVGRLIAMATSPLMNIGEPTAAAMHLPAPTQRTKAGHCARLCFTSTSP